MNNTDYFFIFSVLFYCIFYRKFQSCNFSIYHLFRIICIIKCPTSCTNNYFVFLYFPPRKAKGRSVSHKGSPVPALLFRIAPSHPSRPGCRTGWCTCGTSPTSRRSTPTCKPASPTRPASSSKPASAAPAGS